MFPLRHFTRLQQEDLGNERHPTAVFEASRTDHGAFIDITDRPRSGKTWKWHVGKPGCIPAVAISADGTKVAGAVQQEGGEAIMIWAMPK